MAIIGGAVVSGVAGSVVSSALAPSNSASQSGSAANVAAPFSGQNQQYQSPLASLALGGQGASQGGANSTVYQMQSLLSGGPQAAEALQNTPGYQFQMQQGVGAIDRSAAAGGSLGSGEEMAQLMQYGQGLASTSLNQQVGNLNTLQQAQSANYGNQFNQLSLLSGATTGNTGAAANMQSGQNAASAAMFAPAATALGGAATNGINSYLNPPNSGNLTGSDYQSGGGNLADSYTASPSSTDYGVGL
jgi:hypothetical protein